MTDARRARPGRPLRAARPAPQPRLCGARHPGAGAGDRRQHRDLRAGRRAHAAAARACASPTVWCASSTRTPPRPTPSAAFSYPNYLDLRQGTDVFEELAAFTVSLVGLDRGDGTTRREFAQIVTANYFSTLGASPALGRTFTAEEEKPNTAIRSVVVSHAYWARTGADPAVIGKPIEINGEDYTIVGVAPHGFGGVSALLSTDLWLPLGVYGTSVGQFMAGSRGDLSGARSPRADGDRTLAPRPHRGPGASRDRSDRVAAGRGVSRRQSGLHVRARRADALQPVLASDQGHRVHGGVGGDDGDGRHRAAGRLPQSRQHVPRARRRAPHRDRDPPVARRRSRAHPAPAPHRRVPGLARGRRPRARSSACGRRGGWWLRSFRCCRSAASRSTWRSARGSWSRRSRSARWRRCCSRSDRRSS